MEEDPQPTQPTQSLCPAATKIDYPESQDIMKDIQKKGIKVHDFAYSSAVSSSSAPRLSPVPEIFDQYKGLAEVEYRWTQSHRTYPVQGKTLSRLIDMGWIGQAELSSRAAPMDLEELRKHNARQPMYPWKAFRWTSIPTSEGRKELTHGRTSYFYQWDKIRAEAELNEVKRLKFQRETEEVEERMKEREKQALSQAKWKGKQVEVESVGHKRQFKADYNDDNSMNTPDVGQSDISMEGTESKRRRRLSEEPETMYPAFLIPSKQYPAALHTYDPEIYPEAVYDIGSSSQSQSAPIVPPRTDTPPLSDDEDTKYRLLHPKTRALKRQLSRTQTYTQL